MSGKYKLLLAFWVGLFVASTLMVFVSLQSFSETSGELLPPFPLVPSSGSETGEGQVPIDKPGSDEIEENANAPWSLVFAGVSALISAAGFMTTTYFALRDDRRQTALTELEIRKLASEIERQRLEIEQLRRLQEADERPQYD